MNTKPFFKFAGLHLVGLIAESIFGTLFYLLARGGTHVLDLKNLGPIAVVVFTIVALQAQYLRPVFAMLAFVFVKRVTTKVGPIYISMQLLSFVCFVITYRLVARDDFQFFTSTAGSCSQAFYLFCASLVSSVLVLAWFASKK